MQDHKAPFRPRTRGVPRGQGKHVSGTKGVPITRGTPAQRGLAASRGSAPTVKPPAAFPKVERKCLGVTAKGTDCKARPVKAKDFCQGHLNQLEKVLEDG